MIDYADLMAKAERLRKMFGEDNSSPLDVFSLAQQIDKLTLVFYPFGETISGMCIKGTDNKCTIAINSNMSQGRQRFTMAHELYHLYYDESMASICSKLICKENDTEKKADSFAAYLLMPRAALCEKTESIISRHKGKLNVQDIIRIEQYFKVSHQCTIYQLKNCGYISKAELNSLLNTSVRKLAEAMGYSSELYKPLKPNEQYSTYGYYIEQANELLNREIISQGKYEELLLEAFRDDLVYDEEEGGELID